MLSHVLKNMFGGGGNNNIYKRKKKISSLLPIQSTIDSAQDDLQNLIGREVRSQRIISKGDGIDHISNTGDVGQTIVKFAERLGGAAFVADLKELDANLPGGRLGFIKLFGDGDDDAFDIVARDPVGDDDDVQRLGGRRSSLVTLEIGLEDLMQANPRGCASSRRDGVEDLFDRLGRGHVAVPLWFIRCVVEKVDVDAVRVTGRANWCNGPQGRGCLTP